MSQETARGRLRAGLRAGPPTRRRTGLPTRRTMAAILLLALAPAALSACDDADDDRIEAHGVIEADTSSVVTLAGGRVQEVLVDVGDAVASGQVLVRLDAAALDARLASARAAVEASRSEFERLTSGPRPEEKALADAQLALAMASWEQARRAVAGAGGAGTGQIGPVLAVAEADMVAARATAEAVAAGATAAQLAAAEAAVRQAEAALTALESARDAADLASPIDGRVLERSIQAGEVAPAGAVLLRLTDPATVTVTVYLAERDLSDVELGQEAEVRIEGESDRDFEAAVTAIADRAEFTPRSVQSREQQADLVYAVRLAVQNERLRLKPGMYVTVRLERR